MEALVINMLAVAALIFGLTYAKDADPCKTTKTINEWQRSVAYTTVEGICDNFLREGWYRVTSGAGELMPIECPVGGFRCGTNRPIYISTANLSAGEDVYPGEGDNVTRTAYEASYDGNCRQKEHTIQIKGCHGYYVYYLKPVVGCYAAYCFGDQLPCPDGHSSNTGFTPNCTPYPNVTVTPYVVPNPIDKIETSTHGIDMVSSLAVFVCYADDLTDDHMYTVRWYVNDDEMLLAIKTNLSKTDITTGEARLLEEHWTPFYKPNMLVKCALQITGSGYSRYGPLQMSGLYFAGIMVKQTNMEVFEGDTIELEAKLTMPLSCSWPKNANQASKLFQQESGCTLVLLNGIPGYQNDVQQCTNGISANGIVFQGETCGIKFSYRRWNETQVIKITGQPDQLVNNKNRLAIIRLYNSNEVWPQANALFYWKNIHLPDIKVVVKDKDIATLGYRCHSYNDPHMRTFDGKYWELQRSNGLTAGEYIMYKHNRLPLQVSAYFKPCYRSVLCNCGVAVRSAHSLFVANYCQTVYKGVQRVNRYMIQRLCDDQSLVIEKTSTSYTITLPTGTKVSFSYGSNWINGITIIPSIIDKDQTSGICGSYNGNKTDDFTPRDQITPVKSNKEFASSWKVSGNYSDETLFDPEGKLKQVEYYGQEYCTCVSPDDTFPHGSPEFNCQLTAAMETCRKTKTVHGVYSAACVNEVAKQKRGYNIKKREVVNQENDDLPAVYPMDNEEPPATDETEIADWSNGWSEETARSFCENKFKSAPAYDVCSKYVPFIETESYIRECILDIKYTGGDSWLKVTLQNYAGSCLQESKRLENLTSTNGTNSTGVDKPIAEIIEEVTCPDNCSNHGICLAGECQCDQGYFGDLCDGKRSHTPRIIKEAFEDLCNTRVKPCQSFLLYGDNFIEGADFKCKFTVVKLRQKDKTLVLEKEVTFNHFGTYVTPQYMKCKLPESRKKRATDPVVVATIYHISVSNDGISYTDPVTTIVYNSSCYLCNLALPKMCERKEKCQVDEIEDIQEDEMSIRGIVAGCIAVIVMIVLVILAIIVTVSKKKKTKKSIKHVIHLSDLTQGEKWHRI